MNIIKFERDCPTCDKLISYSRKDGMVRAVKQNRSCFNCNTPKGNKHYRFGKHCSEETKQKISRSKIGVPIHSEEEKEKRRKRWMGDKNPSRKSPAFLGKNHTVKTKEKMRVSYIKTIMKNGGYNPRFNINATKYFKLIDSNFGWNGKYATKNGGEHYIEDLGYWVDYYEPTKNIVIEYDEPKHYYTDGNLKTKDIKRMKKIISHLKCKFYRYNEKRKILKEYFNDVDKSCPTQHY